jgi:sugar phosphate isomerase/epimerase
MFPLVLQIPGIEISGEKIFVERLKILAKHGFMGIEYQLSDFEKEAPERVKTVAADFNLKVTRISTGSMAVRKKLSLSDCGEVGEKTKAHMKDFIDYAAELDIPLILGFIKGPAGQDREKAKQHFIENLSAVVGYAAQKKVMLIIEATNHYETSVAITLAEAAQLADTISNSTPSKEAAPLLQILPDTYHMHIEEINTEAELFKYSKYFKAIHFSDNNRYLPGRGAIDFKKTFAALVAMKFSGYIGLEGNFKDFAQDIALSCDLFSVIERGGNYVDS